MFYNIHTSRLTNTRPDRAVIDGIDFSHPTNEQLLKLGWRIVRNAPALPAEGERIASTTHSNDDGVRVDVEHTFEPDPYYQEVQAYKDAVADLDAAKDKQNVNQAILALEKMNKALARVVNKELLQ